MRTNYYPKIFYYSNQDTQDQFCIDNYHKVERKVQELEEELEKIKQSKYKEIADKVNFNIEEFNTLKNNISNYGKFFIEVFELMKDRGFTKQEFEDVGKNYGMDLSYLFKK